MKHNKTVIIFSVIAVLLLLAVVFFYYKKDDSAQSPPSPIGMDVEPVSPLADQPASLPKEINITVSEPKVNDEVSLPLIVKGQARVFESTVNYRLKDADGSLLVENFTTALSPDMGQFGAFEISTVYPKPKGTKGTVEVFWYSPKDGAELDKVIIPVVFGEVETTNVKVFFGDRNIDPGTLNCDKAYSQDRRKPKTTGVAKAALEQLLAGPTINEGDKGIFTSINQGTKLKSLKIETGTALADFDEMLGLNVAGSCRVMAIRAEIEQTLKQFSTIKNVVISINGKSEDILQP